MQFAEHLRTLLGDRRPPEVAKELRVARSAVYYWLSAEKLPEPKNLTALLRLIGLDTEDAETWRLYLQARRERSAA